MCDWVDPSGNKCSEKGVVWNRGLSLCNRHYNLIRFDNIYRAKHNIEIPEKSCEIKRRIRKSLLKA